MISKRTFSTLIAGALIYFSFWVLSILSGFVWVERLLEVLPASKAQKSKITRDFADFLEKENHKKSKTLLSQLHVVPEKQKSFEKKVGDTRTIASQIEKAKNVANDDNEGLDPHQEYIQGYLQYPENEQFIARLRECFNVDPDPEVQAYLVANKIGAQRTTEDIEVARLTIDRMRIEAESFRKELSHELSEVQDNPHCQKERALLYDVYASFDSLQFK